jgi:hypothetical protein
MSLVQIHAGLSNACLIFSLIVAGYAFLKYLQPQGSVDGGFLGVVAVGELLYLAQVLVGVALAFGDGPKPARLWVHVLYGIVLVITYPAAYTFTRGRDTKRDLIIYAVVALFLAGISLRAVTTAALVAPPGLGG